MPQGREAEARAFYAGLLVRDLAALVERLRQSARAAGTRGVTTAERHGRDQLNARPARARTIARRPGRGAPRRLISGADPVTVRPAPRPQSIRPSSSEGRSITIGSATPDAS